jgi:hypothetical protein
MLPMIKQLLWKWNRLRAMDGIEVWHRVQDALHTRVQSLGLGLARVPAPRKDLLGQGLPWVASLPRQVDLMRHCAAAERILAGYFDVFALQGAKLGFPPDFNRDPKSGTQAPLHFGKSLNYRDEAIVGDIKYLWEPNRHLAATTLAQAYHLTGDLRFAEGVRRMLNAWFDQCPYPLGANWVSSLELAIRLVNWSVTWHLLGGADSPIFAGTEGERFQQRWLASVYQHCHFIAGHESRDSSANNHLFGELLGLFVAGVTWPCWQESARWQHHAAFELERQALLQNCPDGVNREQAVYYHHEVCDMMLFALLLGRANSCPFSARFSEQLEKMLVFLAALIDTRGNVPAIGDADDALLVGWSCQLDFNLYRSLLATGAVLFQRPDFKARATQIDDKSVWLLGDAARDAFANLSTNLSTSLSASPTASPPASHDAPQQQAFAEGGYYLLGNGFGTAHEVKLVADCGPLGFLSIAAHGHADALAFTLSVAGYPILIDPGTFAYHTRQVWRDYFRGTSAHNTVRVDGMDQSEIGGNFLWLRKASSHCEMWSSKEDYDIWVGSHDGYMHLPDHLLHRRKIDYCKMTRMIVVEESIQCNGPHQLEWHWHFAPECELQIRGAALVWVRCGPVEMEIELPSEDVVAQLIRGQEDPPLGWYSAGFDQKVPCTTLRWQESISGSVTRHIRFRIK